MEKLDPPLSRSLSLSSYTSGSFIIASFAGQLWVRVCIIKRLSNTSIFVPKFNTRLDDTYICWVIFQINLKVLKWNLLDKQ